jgi:hypothetical protein
MLSDAVAVFLCAVVPAGYFLKAIGVVLPCPRGQYRAANTSDKECRRCAAGVSTVNEASTDVSACSELLPSFYAKAIVDGVINATAACPQKFYCPGGQATAQFDPNQPDLLNGTSVVACGHGLWTQGLGAVADTECCES